MSRADENANGLFRAGEYRRLLEEFRTAADEPSTIEPNVRVIIAHALAITGGLANAQRHAKALLQDKVAVATHARARLVLAIAAERAGRVDEALGEYKRAAEIAQHGGETLMLGWIRLYEFRLLIEGHSIRTLTGMIPELRRLTTQAGNAQLSAYLHMCIAVLEGQTGRLDQARRHTDCADSLLEAENNSALRSANLVNRGCIAILHEQFPVAIDCFEKARLLTAETGDPFIASRCIGNLAHLCLLGGDLERAKELFVKSLDGGTLGKQGEVGSLDGLARLHLTNNDLSACASILEEIADYQTKHQGSPTMYSVRWAGLTEVRLKIRSKSYPDALETLERLYRDTQAIGDTPFEGAMTLAAAFVAGRLGDARSATQHWIAAERLHVSQITELQAQTYHVASLLTDSNTGLGRGLRERANRLWDAQGVVSTRVELDDTGLDLETARKELRASRLTPPSPPRNIESITNAIAAALDLAHNPRLCGIELLSIIRALDCSPGARLVEIVGDPPENNDTHAVVVLGFESGQQFALVCPVPSTPVKAILLGDVLRLAAAGTALEKAKREERNKSALWPASPVEEQAGALFIAEPMQELLSMVRRVGPLNVAVLITGETGTGKEVLAKTLHGYSERASRPFRPFNCSATPRDMLDAQLFGHRKGAFTGATDNFPGVIRGAAGGTLFLDEIGEMPHDLQPKLLRFLESSEVHPIGETHPTQVNVRVIAATNADLHTLIADGRFREDLFYRLNVIPLHIPPLRQRREEIPVLAQHFLHKSSLELGKRDLRLAEETVEYLVLYRWPGNVRQLANEMRRMTALADNGAVLMPEHLSPAIAASRRTMPPSERKLDPVEIVVRLDQPLAAAQAHIERAIIPYALKKAGGNMEATAAILGLSRKGLYLKRQRLGIEAATDGAIA